MKRGGRWAAISLIGVAFLAISFMFLQWPEHSLSATPTGSATSRAGVDPRAPLSSYQWPTTASRTVTSTFGEFRQTHFHAGLDISTWDKTGYPVNAAMDGYVARILVSPVGYGKMLEVHHKDGYTTVYAHLKKFISPIEARVKEEQTRLSCYPVDIQCTSDAFPVKKGDLIAYTGDTGEGPPHLHFEIRDKNGDPVNPGLFLELGTEDTIPPTIHKVSIAPLEESARVNGRLSPAICRPSRIAHNQLQILDTVHATGRVGFEINARDRTNNSRYSRGVYTHRLYIDDSLVYTVKLDRLPGSDTYQIGLYYDWPLYDAGEGRFEKLYVDGANDLRFYEPGGEESGIIATESFVQGLHTFRIVSTDFNGNSSSVSGRILMNHLPRIACEPNGDSITVHLLEGRPVKSILVYTRGTGDRTWRLRTTVSGFPIADSLVRIPPLDGRPDAVKILAVNGWGTRSLPCFEFRHPRAIGGGSLELKTEIEPEFVQVTLTTDKVFTSPPSAYVYEEASRRPIELEALDPETYFGTFRPLETFQGTRRLFAQGEVNGKAQTVRREFDLYPITRGSKGNLTLDNGNLRIAYDSLSVLKTVYLHIEKFDEDGEPGYLLLPERAVLDHGLSASVRVPPLHVKRGLLYHTAGSRRLIAIGRSDSDTVLTGRLTRTLGELRTFTDTEPPYVTRVRIRNLPSHRPTITFRFGDDLSGIEYDELKTYIDGSFIIPELDGEHHVASCQVDHPLTRGSHRLTIRLKDRLGNSNEVNHEFMVR